MVVLVRRGIIVGGDDVGAFVQDGWQFVEVEAGVVVLLVGDGVVEVDFIRVFLIAHFFFRFFRFVCAYT